MSEPLVANAYVLLLIVSAITLLTLLISIIVSLFKNTKQLLKVGLGILSFLIVISISYFCAASDTGNNTETIVSTGLYTLYSITIIAIIGVVFSEIRTSITN